jgi:phenylacetate-CoA ligase
MDKFSEHIPLWFIRQLSEKKLVQTLRYVYRNSPVQRQRWTEAGLKLSDLRSAEALQQVPFTKGPELARHPEDYICVGQDELIHVLTSSCTKGLRKKLYLTADDFIDQVRIMGAHLRRLPGATRIAIMFSVDDPYWSTGAVLRRGIEEAGMFGLLSGVHRSIPEQIELIKEFQINCLMTTPSYAGRLALEAPLEVKDLKVLYLHLSAQAWTEEFRSQMEKTWAAKIIDGYGSSESTYGIAVECPQQDGLHISEVDYWVEIVDPATGAVLPEGSEGEIVFTTLSKRGMPLVRYRTGDLSYLMPRSERCPCGVPLRRMGRVRGRVDDMLVFGSGENVYPDEIDRAVLSVTGVTDYQLVIDEDKYKDVLHLKVEANSSSASLRDILIQALLGIPGIRISHEADRVLSFGSIERVAPGSLSKGRPKSIRITDKRSGLTAPKAASIPS